MRLGLGRETNVSRNRMAPATYFLPLEQPKMQVWWIQKGDFSSSCKALRTHFLLLDQPKMRFIEVEKAMFQVVEWHFEVIFYFLTVSLSTRFRPPDHPKVRIGWGREAMFQGTEWNFQPTMDLWACPKNELGEFNKASFLVVVRHCEHIFLPFTYPNCDLVEVVKAMNEDGEWQENVFAVPYNH